MKILLILLLFGFLSCGTVEPTPKSNSTAKPYKNLVTLDSLNEDSLTKDSHNEDYDIDTVLRRKELLEAFLKFGISDNDNHLIDSIILFEETDWNDTTRMERSKIVSQTFLDRSLFDKAFFYRGKLMYYARDTTGKEQKDTLIVFDRFKISRYDEFDSPYNQIDDCYYNPEFYISRKCFTFDTLYRLKSELYSSGGCMDEEFYHYHYSEKLTHQIESRIFDHAYGDERTTKIRYVKLDSHNNWVERIRFVSGHWVDDSDGEEETGEYKKQYKDKRIIYYK